LSDTGPSLVVGVSTRALFDLEFENTIFERDGLPSFRKYQREHENDPVPVGTALPLVRDLLAINARSADGPLVEVVLLSRNDPDSAMRVFNSMAELGLPITRGAFRGGRDPWPFLETYRCDLFLSADPADVRAALEKGTAAALVSHPPETTPADDVEVRIAFDADSVLFDETSDRIWETGGAEAYFRHETENATVPLEAGPFKPFLVALSRLQARFPEDASPIRIAVVTARTAPAHVRVINTFRAWNIRIDEIFFLGNLPKVDALIHLRPHIFLDDRREHVERAASTVPSAQVLPRAAAVAVQLPLLAVPATRPKPRRPTASPPKRGAVKAASVTSTPIAPFAGPAPVRDAPANDYRPETGPADDRGFAEGSAVDDSAPERVRSAQ
jgi:5'-nucleotidase